MVLTCAHNLCFEQNYEKNQLLSTEILNNFKKYLCITWVCFRNMFFGPLFGDGTLLLIAPVPCHYFDFFHYENMSIYYTDTFLSCENSIDFNVFTRLQEKYHIAPGQRILMRLVSFGSEVNKAIHKLFKAT